MRANLQASLFGFRLDLYRELSAVCVAFQLNPGSDSHDRWVQYAQHYQQWSRTAAHPRLVADVFVWKEAESRKPNLRRITAETGALEPVAWPAKFSALHDTLGAFSANMGAMFQHRRFASTNGEPPRLLVPPGAPGQMPWAVEQAIPALVYPVIEPVTPTETPDQQNRIKVNWIIIELNETVLRDKVFHELADRYFSGPDGYRIAVTRSDDKQPIYSSDMDFHLPEPANADGSMPLFGGPTGGSAPGPNIFLAPPPLPLANRSRDLHLFAGNTRFEPLRASSRANDWVLVAQHRNGSLESSVAALRRRSLMISFAVLLVLAATMAIIVVTSRRAQHLAKLQMDFVTAVSHELRTPLTVISSAGDNIARGIVDSKEQFMRYGTVIKRQSQQLIGLVEQILLFAATQQRNHPYRVERLEVAKVIDTAVQSTSGLLQAAGFVVETKVQQNLPPIEGDLVALSQCLQNLITNAVKYGGEARWLGIRAAAQPVDSLDEVQISVEDKGIGIPAAEIERIFEPFYRSASATAAQIHGTGLGLPLAKSIAEAMNGRLTVLSREHRGSTFVLHLPAAVRGQEAGAQEEFHRAAAECERQV